MMDIYAENQNKNSGLNGKLYIIENLDIFNYPSHSVKLGNLQNDKLDTFIQNAAKSWHWDISKDQIEVCADCKYRCICVDFEEIVAEGDSYKRKNPCNYSPYSNTWENT